MKRTLTTLVSLYAAGLIGLFPCAQAASEAEDTFQFFQEEAKVVSASRIPQSRSLAPATTYVVTSEEIAASGVQTIWDALRSVPGVDVMQTRTNQAEISIRGLDHPLNNRTLILLDGENAGWFLRLCHMGSIAVQWRRNSSH